MELLLVFLFCQVVTTLMIYSNIEISKDKELMLFSLIPVVGIIFSISAIFSETIN